MTAVAGGNIQAADITALAALTTGRPLVRLIQQAAQSIANNSSVALQFGSGSEDIDTHGFHDTASNTSRITPTIAGYYEFEGTYWTSSSTLNNVNMQCFIAKNGTIQPAGYRHNWTGGAAVRSISARAKLLANGTTDYFELIVLQASGGAVNTQVGGSINSVLEAEFLRPQ